MKKLLCALTFFISAVGVAQHGYWYDVLYEVTSENTEKFTFLLNDFYSSKKIPDDIEAEFSKLIYKGSNEKATHVISFSSSSSKSLAKFKASLVGRDWDVHAAKLLKYVEREYAFAGNNTNFSDIPDDALPTHTIFQAWTYNVTDVTNFKNAFEKLINTIKPNGYLGMGDIVHGSDGANVWIFKTYADL
jgi:hypothetical protein